MTERLARFHADHTGLRPWDHRFGVAHLTLTGLVATVILSLVDSLAGLPRSLTFEILVPQLVVATLWFTAAYTASDLLYHAVRRG